MTQDAFAIDESKIIILLRYDVRERFFGDAAEEGEGGESDAADLRPVELSVRYFEF